MSGIIGLLNLDGEAIDEQELGRLTKLMQYRGPDAQSNWCDGRIGFGHAMLRTTFEAQYERQPCTLDSRVWIVADARIDGRPELCRALRSSGQDCRENATDAELILHAYRAWGEACVRNLLGDFAFAIWDSAHERLFCARDHFGIKPFFYAHTGNSVVFSNTLNCMRAHPAISDELNDGAIADFLLFGTNQDQASTAFAAIRRLPPAHRMRCAAGRLRVERYWDLPSETRQCRRKPAEIVDGFVERLNAAVADRLRSDRIGILMSGGIDSTAIAASAKALLSERHSAFDLRAYTCVYDRLFADEERLFAALAADSLGIHVHYLVADDYALFEGWQAGKLRFPEPTDEPLAALYLAQARQMAANGRVALTGWDGDALCSESAFRYGNPFNKLTRIARRAAGVGRRVLFPPLWPKLDVRAWLARRLPGSPEEACRSPVWLNASLVERLNRRGRWQKAQVSANPPRGAHAEAHRVLKSPLFTNLLESYDAGVTGIPVEARHPLLDLRVVEYVLGLPVSPWCADKKLLRMAMRGRLPEAVRLRAKTPLAADPVVELLKRADGRWVDTFEATPALAGFVNRAAVPAIAGAEGADEIWTNLRPLCLNLWLQHAGVPQTSARREELHEVA